MKRDIETYKDIYNLIDTFYGVVRKDDVIGYIFNDVMDLNWDEHTEKIAGFWNTILFSQPTYTGNPVKAHIGINRLERLTEDHFDRWYEIWTQTIDKIFDGPKADEAKEKASLMKALMLFKIRHSEKNTFIQ